MINNKKNTSLVSLRLENDDICRLKVLANLKSFYCGKDIAYTDLVRDAIKGYIDSIPVSGSLNIIHAGCSGIFQ
jgi:hypothetical protein